MAFSEHKITNTDELNQLLNQGVFYRQKIGLIVLDGNIETHPQKSFWQNELNTYYYACGCDESAGGFFIGVILGSLWIASSWSQGEIPGLITVASGVLLAIVCGLVGKVVGKLKANKKLKQTVRFIQNAWD